MKIIDKPTIPAERPGREYVEEGDIRLIVQDGIYEGWYSPRMDATKSSD